MEKRLERMPVQRWAWHHCHLISRWRSRPRWRSTKASFLTNNTLPIASEYGAPLGQAEEGRPPMKSSSYRDRDYAFGQRMLTLRTDIGLTQAGLADLLHVSRRAVAQWEAGSAYPKAEHLKAFLALCVQQQAFPAGRETEEIHSLWKAAHQKILLDELWLHGLLAQQPSPLIEVAVEQTRGADRVSAPQASGEPRLDWGEALDVPSMYGREQELATLARWVVQERCRLVSVLGMGGMGKSALVVRAMQQLAGHFDVVLFRSLRDAPFCDALLDDCLQVLAPESLARLSQDLERRLSLLLEEMRSRRVLLVLDNLEVLLEEGEVLGRLRPGFEAYGHLLRRVAETTHQSCLLLTSREKPAALRALEGRHTLVRALRLGGLDAAAGEQLLAEHEVRGSSQERAHLVEAYSGNPLALNIVAETIADLFGGAIDQFLAGGTVIFGGITELLEEQWARLSPLEQTVLCWLAILREPVTLDELFAVLVSLQSRVQVLEAVDSLRRRSLIERGQRAGSFTLQSVVLECVTTKLVTTASQEIGQGRLERLLQHGLAQAQAKEYVRQTQERLLLAPVLARLQSVYQERAELEGRLRKVLETLRGRAEEAQGYGPANLVALLCLLRGDLRGLDLSQLALRGVYLQGVELQDATLSGALIRECVFTEAFDAITAGAISRSGQYWAAASRRGEVRVWREAGQTLHLVWQAHTDMVWTLAFSPDERRLASASWDGSVKLWELESGRCLQTLVGHTERVQALAWSPDGGTLASGSFDHAIRLWDGKAGTSRVVLQGHSAVVTGLAFTPDSRHLLSGSGDGTLRLWDVERGESLRVMQGYSASLLDLDWSPDGTQLVSGGSDTLVTLWDVASGTLLGVLRGHRWSVYGVAWSPDGSLLASSGWDNAIRLWDPATDTCVQVLRDLDHPETPFFGVAWSPDGQLLACGTVLQGVVVWDVTARSPRWADRAHVTWIRRVAWSPEGPRLVGGDEDGHVSVWDARGGTHLLRLAGHHGAVTSVAWSPDGSRLASGSGSQRQGDAGELFVWDAHSGQRVHTFAGHPGVVSALSWAPSGELVLSGGSDGRLRWWDVQSGECVRVREAHQGAVQALKVSHDGNMLASCGDDWVIALWDWHSGEALRRLRRDRPYERLTITGIRGLTEAQLASLRALGALEDEADEESSRPEQIAKL